MKYVKILDYKSIRNKTKFYTLVKNELYTAKEFDKLNKQFNINKKDYTIIDIPKSQTYWFFGARLQIKGGEL